MNESDTVYSSSKSSDGESMKDQTPDATATFEGRTSQGSKPKRRAVACKSCHTLKVKCTPSDPNDPAGPCVRCLNTNRKCDIDLNYARKRRKKDNKFTFVSKEPIISSEHRIAKLEEKLRDVQGKLERYERNDDLNEVSKTKMSDADVMNELNALNGLQRFNLDDLANNLKSYSEKRTSLLGNFNINSDMISLGIVSLEEARERLDIYRNLVFKSYPFIEIEASTTVEEMRKKTPFLLNAVLSVSNIFHNSDSEQSLTIDNIAVRTISTEVLVNATKSIELVKSLLLLCIWYNTPELFKNRRYHLLNGMAVSLIYDIGIICRPTYSYKVNEGVLAMDKPIVMTLEYRSLVLIVFFSAVGICLILRRSIYVKWTPFIEESCSILENSKDIRFVEIALFSRLNHQLESIHHVIHSNEILDRDKSSTQFLISGFQNQLNEIKAKVKENNYPFLSYFYSVEAYLHEPEMNGTSEFKLNEQIVRSISKCSASCLNALQAFNNMSPEDVAVMPFIYSARIIYTAGMLMRLRFLMISAPNDATHNIVPVRALRIIEISVKLLDDTYLKHKNNFCLMKLRLILQLFIQTYTTQVQSLKFNPGDVLDQFSMEQTKKGHPSVLQSPSSTYRNALQKMANGKSLNSLNDNSNSNPASMANNGSKEPQHDSIIGSYPSTQEAALENNGHVQKLKNGQAEQGSINYNSNGTSNQNFEYSDGSSNYPNLNNILNNPNLGDPDDFLVSVDDGFWANLLNSDSDKLIFSNMSSGYSNDNAFFMP